jgi:hypothetical protein
MEGTRRIQRKRNIATFSRRTLSKCDKDCGHADMQADAPDPEHPTTHSSASPSKCLLPLCQDLFPLESGFAQIEQSDVRDG